MTQTYKQGVQIWVPTHPMIFSMYPYQASAISKFWQCPKFIDNFAWAAQIGCNVYTHLYPLSTSFNQWGTTITTGTRNWTALRLNKFETLLTRLPYQGPFLVGSHATCRYIIQHIWLPIYPHQSPLFTRHMYKHVQAIQSTLYFWQFPVPEGYFRDWPCGSSGNPCTLHNTAATPRNFCFSCTVLYPSVPCPDSR